LIGTLSLRSEPPAAGTRILRRHVALATPRRTKLPALRTAAVAAALAFACATVVPRVYEARAPDVRLSLLVLGDWGRRLDSDGKAPDAQLRVAEALADEDRHAPVDGIVFVGDNFYPKGLAAADLELRVRGNLVAPYCRFVELTERALESMGGACPAGADRHPVPLWAVLGNHDHHSAESRELEASGIPALVSNWRLLGRPIDTLELPQGVSFVFYDSTKLRLPSGAPDLPKLTRALRESKGPWRVLVAHHPLDSDQASQGIVRALAESDVRADLLLAGHIHDLRASALEPPYPALQLVSGGGGGKESRERPLPGQIWQLASTGFARVDLVGSGPREHLRLRFFAVSANRNVPRVVAAWSLFHDGVLENEAAALH